MFHVSIKTIYRCEACTEFGKGLAPLDARTFVWKHDDDYVYMCGCGIGS